MKRCYELAIHAGKKGFDTFGAILVHNDEILEEGMHVFEWWGGEYRPLAELIAEMEEVKKKNK